MGETQRLPLFLPVLPVLPVLPFLPYPPFLPHRPSVSEGQTIPAVIAADRRFDNAGAVAVAAGRQWQQQMARVPAIERRVDSRSIRVRLEVPGDRTAHEFAEFLLGHVLGTAVLSPWDQGLAAARQAPMRYPPCR